ncbi:MAG: Gmad2 immunoglobulin-like domain-containing protein [Actinomycetota bacterium]
MQTESTTIPFRAIAAAIGIIAIVAAGVLTLARPTKASVTVVTDGPTEPTVVVEPEPTPAPEEAAAPADGEDAEATPEPAEDIEGAEPTPGPTAEPIDDVVAPPAPTPTPEPIDDFAAPAIDCAETFTVGRWNESGPGSNGTATALGVDTAGSCETVTVVLDGPAPDVDVTRISYLNWTMVRFDTDAYPEWPAPDLVTVDGDVVNGAVAFSDSSGTGLFVTHPVGVQAAADVDIDGDTITVRFRERTDADTEVDGYWGGEPYTQQFDGLPHQGLVVLLATELEGSGQIGLTGYARAPEANVVVRIWDGDTLLDETPMIAEGPAYAYGRWSHDFFAPANGTYTVEVGWDSPADDPEFDVWWTTDIDVIGVT